LPEAFALVRNHPGAFGGRIHGPVNITGGHRPVNSRAVEWLKSALRDTCATLAPPRAANATHFGPFSPDSSVVHCPALP